MIGLIVTSPTLVAFLVASLILAVTPGPGVVPAALSTVFVLVKLAGAASALFFAAFLPQFLNAGASPLAQSLVSGCVFVCIAMCTDPIYVLTAATLGERIRQRSTRRPFGKYVTAATFIGLGAYAAFASPRAMR
jgi:threonine/homoserine/homoserine lactone efflux protein